MPVAAPQERQLDDACRSGDDPAALAHEVDCRLHGPAGREQIVEHDDPLTRPDRVLLDLEGVGPVFEIVGEANRFPRQFALFANHGKAAAEFISERRSDKKAAGFDADQQFGLVRPQRRSPGCSTVVCQAPGWASNVEMS